MEPRQHFTTSQFVANGHTKRQLYYGEEVGRFVQARHGIWLPGSDPPTPLEFAIGQVFGTEREATGLVAGTLLGLDGVPLENHVQTRVRRPTLAGDPIKRYGVRCANGLQTIVDLAALLDDSRWEMANESALHKKLYALSALEGLLPLLTNRRVPGTARIRRVLALRPLGAPPTESALETLMVQLIRTLPTVPEPTRQLRIFDEFGVFVARVDLCWPELGVFIELDGQGHKGQPVYDASRESAVVATTGWLPGRFTWKEVFSHPKATGHRLVRLLEQASRRPLVPAK